MSNFHFLQKATVYTLLYSLSNLSTWIQNLEADDLGQMHAYTSESVHEDQTEETLPLTTKSETKEEGNNVQEQTFNSIEQQILGENSEEAKEIKKEVEPNLMIEDHVNEAQSPNENIKDVIPTEVRIYIHNGLRVPLSFLFVLTLCM